MLQRAVQDWRLQLENSGLVLAARLLNLIAGHALRCSRTGCIDECLYHVRCLAGSSLSSLLEGGSRDALNRPPSGMQGWCDLTLGNEAQLQPLSRLIIRNDLDSKILDRGDGHKWLGYMLTAWWMSLIIWRHVPKIFLLSCSSMGRIAPFIQNTLRQFCQMIVRPPPNTDWQWKSWNKLNEEVHWSISCTSWSHMTSKQSWHMCVILPTYLLISGSDVLYLGILAFGPWCVGSPRRIRPLPRWGSCMQIAKNKSEWMANTRNDRPAHGTSFAWSPAKCAMTHATFPVVLCKFRQRPSWAWPFGVKGQLICFNLLSVLMTSVVFLIHWKNFNIASAIA